MILYHGTNIVIDVIDLEKCRPYKDFGRGFYTTEIEAQAVNMAYRVSKAYGGSPIVNVYDIEDDFLTLPHLNIKDFGSTASEEWARFVMNNRSRLYFDYSNPLCNHDNKYDIVAGPVADDNMAYLFRQYENSLITFDMLVSGLIYRTVTNQYSFHTESSCVLLRKLREDFYD